jgi:hypothetical protein
MANAVVTSWTARIKELQQLLDTADVPNSDFAVFMLRMTRLGEQPPLSHAIWKKLVQNVQVNCAGMGAVRAGGLRWHGCRMCWWPVLAWVQDVLVACAGMGAGCAGGLCWHGCRMCTWSVLAWMIVLSQLA